MNIQLRKWQPDDLDNLVLHADNYKIARNLTNQFPHPYTREAAEAFIGKVSEQDPLQVFAITLDDQAIGGIGIFQQQDIQCRNAEMGYWLAETFWGKGIITIAIKKMIEYSFSTFDINRIYARPFGSNIASQKALEKAGFVKEAFFEKTLFKFGEYEDEYVYSIRNN